MRKFRFFILPLCLFLTPQMLQADPITITFEGLASGALITNQFLGLVFSNATVLTSGIDLNEFEFPPFSGTNVVFDDGGPISILFSAPVFSVGGYFTYVTPVTIAAFDALNNPLGSISSTFLNNLALSGDPGSSPNEFLQLNSVSGISGITITGDPFGSSFTLDNLTYSTTSPIPEPSTVSLILVGGLAVAFISRKKLFAGFTVDNGR